MGQLQRLLRSKYIANQLLSIMKYTEGMQRQWLLTVLCLVPEELSWEQYYLSCGLSGRASGLPHKLKQHCLQQGPTGKGDKSHIAHNRHDGC